MFMLYDCRDDQQITGKSKTNPNQEIKAIQNLEQQTRQKRNYIDKSQKKFKENAKELEFKTYCS